MQVARQIPVINFDIQSNNLKIKGVDVHIYKLAKLVIGVNNIVVENVTYDEIGQQIIIDAKPTKWHSHKCGKCGCKAKHYDGKGKMRMWRCLDVASTKCFVRSQALRVKCPHCGVVARKVPWAGHDSYFTYTFEQTCAWHALNMSKLACTKLMRIQWRTVGDICARVEARLSSTRPALLDNLKRIGVDETSYKKGHKYMTVVINHDTGAVVWCAKGYGEKVFAQFFEQLTPKARSEIELVSADGARWVDSTLAKYCHNTKRCIDTFHVVSWATDVLDEVRKQAWRQAHEKVKCAAKTPVGRPRAGKAVNKEKKCANKVKGYRYPLLKNPENLTQTQAIKLEMLVKSNPRLYRAYLLKEELRLALKQPVEKIESALKKWRGHAWRSKIPEFVKLQRKIKRHMQAIIQTAKSGITNARVEAVNNSIKLIVKTAFGFRNFDNLKSMVMLKLSGLNIELPRRKKQLHK